MAEGNVQDKALQRAQFRKALSRLSPKQRVDALLSEKNTRAAVASVPADELYRTVLEVGLADTTELVQLAAPSQFKTFVDLGAWKKDELDVHELLLWLRAAHGDDEEDFLKKVDAVDLEVLELLLRRTVNVYDLEETPDVNPSGVTMESPEGKYLLEFKVDGPDLAGLKALLHSLIARDPFAFGRMLEAVRWEVESELEEEAYRFRAARLQDLGYPELYDALSLFSFVDPHKAHADAGAALTTLSHVDYLNAALERLTEHERDTAEEELRFVINQALVAEGADPGDLAALRRVAEMAHDYLSLGIEHLANSKPDKAVEVLRDVELKRIFQIGFSLTLQLKFRVDRMAKAELTRIGDVWLLLPEEANAVKALARKRPLKAVKVPGAEPMPFRNRRELHESWLLLDRAEAQLFVFRKLLGGTKESAAAILARFDAPLQTLGTERLFAASVALAALGEDVSPRPFPVERFGELLKRVISERDQARAAAVTGLRSLGDEAVVSAMVDRTLDAFHEEWGAAFRATGSFNPHLVLALPLTTVKTL